MNQTVENTLFWFEKDHDVSFATNWVQTTGHYVVPVECTVYLTVIFLKPYFAPYLPKMDLKFPLFLWNLGLATFSIFGTARMVPALVSNLGTYGFEYSLCNSSFTIKAPTAFWTEYFGWSKQAELLDTLFLVLRNRPIIFLHWYHHVTVLLFTWHACIEHASTGQWFITMNFTVHAMMYSYYTVRSLGVKKIPKIIPMTVTAFQLGQMLIGCYVAASAYWLILSGRECQQSLENLYLCFFIYLTYGMLFAQFFWKAYIWKPSDVKEKLM